MRLEYIESFISVVNCKSFSGAAKQTFLSQPTISTHIKHLESELGVQLLVRSTKDVVLSEAGLIFYPYAVRLLETEKEALAQLGKSESKVQGTVTVAASSVPCNYILPQFLKYSRKIYPDLLYKLCEGDSDKVIQSVLRFEADLGVGSIMSTNEKCMCIPLIQDRIVLVTPNTVEYQRLNGKFPVERLKKEVFVARESGSGTKLAAESIERALGLQDKPLVAVQVESSEMVKRGVKQGLGVAFVSNFAVAEEVEQGKLLKFEFPEVKTSRQLYLMYHRDRVITHPVSSVIKAFRQYCQNITDQNNSIN